MTVSQTSIEWTDATWSPIRGCSRKSTGCENCYAEKIAGRFSGTGQPFEGFATMGKQGAQWTGKVELVPEHLVDPLRWRKGRKIFTTSMSDVFHEKLSNEDIAAIFGVMAACPQHTFQLLTKRPERAVEWFASNGIAERVEFFKHLALAGRIEEYFAPERSSGIPGFPDYEVTTHGRVMSLRGADICKMCGKPIDTRLAHKKYCSRQCISKAHYEKNMGRFVEQRGDPCEMHYDRGGQGHKRVTLHAPDGQTARHLVHRLVLEIFDRTAVGNEQACHINGDPGQNALWNLRWGSQSSNWDDRKRHGNQQSYTKITSDQANEIRRLGSCGVRAAEIGRMFGISDTQARNIINMKQWIPNQKPIWPLPWVWIGASVENQKAADERIPSLLKVPAAVRFLSCEPLLGPINFGMDPDATTNPRGLLACISCRGHGFHTRSTFPDVRGNEQLSNCPECRDGIGLHWVIAGAESGPGARPMQEDWVRSLRDQCTAANIPFFYKQKLEEKKKVPLPLLDGKQWAQFPVVNK